MKIAFIVQRYGAEILGGSEYHCRLIAERLAPKHQVEVLTTCAADYITWKNEYPEGTDRIRGVTVRRFANAQTRDIHAFNRYSEWIFTSAHTRDDEMEWLRQQGPWCPALLEYLERNQQQSRRPDLLHLPVRADGARRAHRAAQEHPGADGARRAGDPPRHLQGAVQPAGRPRLQHRGRTAVPDDALLDPRGRRGNGRLRRRPAAGASRLRDRPGEIARTTDRTPRRRANRRGRGADEEESPTFRPHLAQRGTMFRRRHRLHGPFALYGGRIDPGKGCEELIEYFSSYVQEGGDASLALMGVKLMPLPEEPFIRFAGRLSDQERLQALEAATVVVVPSPYESLSLLALESFAVGTPILANARSEVLVDHCHKSNAGLYYADRDEFIECLKLLIADPHLRAAHGPQRPASTCSRTTAGT